MKQNTNAPGDPGSIYRPPDSSPSATDPEKQSPIRPTESNSRSSSPPRETLQYGVGQSGQDEINLLDLLTVLVKRWRLAAGLSVTFGALAALVYFVVPSAYSAKTMFVPEVSTQRGLPAGLAGLAGQFGISLSGEAGQSAYFYAQVLTTPAVMDEVLTTRLPDPRSRTLGADSASLLEILEAEGDSLPEMLHEGREELIGSLNISVDDQTSVVTLAIETGFPELSAAVANRFVEVLARFNAESRQSQARERRRFIEERLEEAAAQLDQSEEAIKRFYVSNRTWQQSPQLSLQQESLQRQVQIQQEVFLTLRREYETARIAEVNDTPVITIVQRAHPPQEESSASFPLLVMLGIGAGVFIGFCGSFVVEFATRARSREPRAYAQLDDAFASLKRDLRQFLPGRR